jgi:6-phosphogluconolactonase
MAVIPRFAFVSHAESGEVVVLSMAADGTLATAHSLALGGTLMPMALHPNGRHLYVARRSDPMALISLSFNPGTGHLTRLSEAPLPASMAYLCTDPAGQHLLAASYPGHLLSVSPIGADGAAGQVQQIVPTGLNAHAVVFAPSGRHVLATNLGGAQLMQLHWHADTGQLSPNTVPAWSQRPGAGPRHLRFHPSGHVVYLLNELDATMDVLAFDTEKGTLSHLQTVPTVPPGFDGTPSAADLHLTPDGRFLYTSERASSTLACFAVNPESGWVQPLHHTPTETGPRGFAIDPTGEHLLAAGQLSHQLSRYRINASTGVLTLAQRLPTGLGPNWIVFSPSPPL